MTRPPYLPALGAVLLIVFGGWQYVSASTDGVTADQYARRLSNEFVATPTIPPPPPPYVWDGPLPNYGGRGACTRERASWITKAFADAGANRETQVRFLEIASRETGCNTMLHNYNPATEDDSYGWCQLNAKSGHFGPNGILNGWDRHALLSSWDYAIAACVEMWRACGVGPWAYPNYYCRTPPELR